MQQNNGFSLIEVLVAFSIISMVAITILPLLGSVNQKKEILSERRIIASRLSDELQPYLSVDVTLPKHYTGEYHSTTLHFQFMKEQTEVKGCVTWKNVTHQTEQICLYGLQAS